jgi:FdhD protein
VDEGFSFSRSDLLAIEEPLQFCLHGSPLSITMRTPDCDLDLATGFPFTEGIVDDIGQILSMRADAQLALGRDSKLIPTSATH